MIDISSLKKSYTNPENGESVTILDIESFQSGPDQQIALRGPSGSGKTTLLHCISGMITPDSGSIIIKDTDITALSESRRDRFRANHIGYIFQSFNLLDAFSALENVMLGMMFADGGSRKEKAVELLKSVGLGHRLHYKPSQLSVGQQQRVCIARAIANDPEVLLADEPTGSLDPAASREVLELLQDVAKKRTLLLVSHEESVLAGFEHVTDLTTLNRAAIV